MCRRQGFGQSGLSNRGVLVLVDEHVTEPAGDRGLDGRVGEQVERLHLKRAVVDPTALHQGGPVPIEEFREASPVGPGERPQLGGADESLGRSQAEVGDLIGEGRVRQERAEGEGPVRGVFGAEDLGDQRNVLGAGEQGGHRRPVTLGAVCLDDAQRQ